ncbi:MAG: MFS transporter [Succinivibrio sp.]|nr:MFS transporter [Succinivibrio sp.]
MQKIDSRVYLLSCGHFSVDWAQGAIPALLPYFISVCHLSYQAAGTLIFANILLSSLLQPIFGYYADKVSRPWFAPLGLIVSGFAVAAMGFVSDYAVIFALSMLSGTGSAIYHPEAARMASGLGGPLKGRAMGTFAVGGNAGFAAGPAVAGFCAYVFDPKALIVFALVNLFFALLLHARLGSILRDLKTQGAKISAAKAEQPCNEWSSFGRLCVVIFCRSVVFSVCNAFIPLYWIGVLKTEPSSASLAITFMWALGAVFTYFGGFFSDRGGFVRVLRLSFIVMIPAMALIANSPNVPLAVLAIIPASFGLFACYSPMVILGQTYLAKNIAFASGVTFGLNTTIGGMLSPLVGRLADNCGIQAALQVLWIAALIGAIASLTLKTPAALKKARGATKRKAS